MKIKRFVAPDMRSAMKLVREEQGPNAVILSNRRVHDGIEVIAATDYDEALVQQALRTSIREQDVTIEDAMRGQAVETPAPARRTIAKSQHATPRIATRAVETRAAQPRTEDAGMLELRKELAELRKMIGREMNSLGDAKIKLDPTRSQVLDLLIDIGCEAAHAREIAATIPSQMPLKDAHNLMLKQLSYGLPVTDDEALDAGGIIALVGPTGVGKTTTVAKMAARYAAKHGARNVALLTLDGYRIGAREQLFTYGRLLGMPVFEAASADDLQRQLGKLKEYPLILVDTAGTSPRDLRLSLQLKWLSANSKNLPIRNMLVIPANSQAAVVEDALRRFEEVQPEAVVLTKLDEAGRIGAALSVLKRKQVPVAYVTDGQRVPEDIHKAHGRILVLLAAQARQAVQALAMENNYAAA